MTLFVNLSETGGRVPKGIKIAPGNCVVCNSKVKEAKINDESVWICDELGHIETFNERTKRFLIQGEK